MSRRIEQGQETRRQVIEAAMRLFAERGYDGTSIETVLEETGLSRGALYHHFASKDALFAAVLEEVEAGIARDVVAASRTATNPVDALRAGCRAWLRVAENPATRRIALLDAPAVLGWERWREIDGRHGFGLLKGALRAVAAEGLVREGVVDLLAHMLLAALLEVVLVVARADDRQAATRAAEAAVDELLDGLLDAEA